MLLAVAGKFPDYIKWNARPLFLVEPFADWRDAVSRPTLQVTFLDEEPGEDSKEVQIVVPRLRSVGTVDENIVQERDTELPIELVDVVKRIAALDVFS